MIKLISNCLCETMVKETIYNIYKLISPLATLTYSQYQSQRKPRKKNIQRQIKKERKIMEG